MYIRHTLYHVNCYYLAKKEKSNLHAFSQKLYMYEYITYSI